MGLLSFSKCPRCWDSEEHCTCGKPANVQRVEIVVRHEYVPAPTPPAPKPAAPKAKRVQPKDKF